MSENQLVIVLEEKPEKGIVPLSMLDRLITAKECGDRAPKPGKGPLPTALVRAALTAYAENIDLINEARRIGLTGTITRTFSEIVKYSLTQAIRFKKFADEKKNADTPKENLTKKTRKPQPEGINA
jgi:hypothetical protein